MRLITSSSKCLLSWRVLNKWRIIPTISCHRKSSQAVPDEKPFENQTKVNPQNDEADRHPPGWSEALPFEALPGPKPLPLVGNLWRLLPRVNKSWHGKDFRDVIRMLHEEHGDIFIIKGMKTIPQMVYLFSPTDIETLFRNEGRWPIRRGFPSIHYYRQVIRKDLFEYEGVFTAQGEEWSKTRSIVNPIVMKPKNVLHYVDKMNLVAEDFVDKIRYIASRDKNGEMPENFMKEFYKWSLESVGLVTLDRRLGCLDKNVSPDSQLSKFISDVIDMMSLVYKLDIMPSMWKTVSTPTWRHFVQLMDNITDTSLLYINEAKTKLKEMKNMPEEEGSMLQQLLERNPKMAMVMVADLLGGGVDTTARVLAAALYFLAKNPEKQRLLREEAVALLPSKTSLITSDTLSSAQYTKAVIKETTRIAPIGTGNQRTTVKNMVLGGYQIPKGTHVMACTLIVSNDEKYVPRPHDFIPERWLRTTTGELSMRNTNPFVSLPFGYGPRSCIGKRIANVEFEVALLKLIRNFELSWPHEDMIFKGKLLYGIAAPLKIRVSEVNY